MRKLAATRGKKSILRKTTAFFLFIFPLSLPRWAVRAAQCLIIPQQRFTTFIHLSSCSCSNKITTDHGQTRYEISGLSTQTWAILRETHRGIKAKKSLTGTQKLTQISYLSKFCFFPPWGGSQCFFLREREQLVNWFLPWYLGNRFFFWKKSLTGTQKLRRRKKTKKFTQISNLSKFCFFLSWGG